MKENFPKRNLVYSAKKISMPNATEKNIIFSCIKYKVCVDRIFFRDVAVTKNSLIFVEIKY